jgi:hypothetical protein
VRRSGRAARSAPPHTSRAPWPWHPRPRGEHIELGAARQGAERGSPAERVAGAQPAGRGDERGDEPFRNCARDINALDRAAALAEKAPSAMPAAAASMSTSSHT